MRSFSFARTWPLTAEPTPSEAYVQQKFGEAIVFARVEWGRFDAQFARGSPFSLTQRLGAFLDGPIGMALQDRFQAIAAIGAEADALTEMSGNTRIICKLIVGEAVIAAGDGTRGEIRGALPD